MKKTENFIIRFHHENNEWAKGHSGKKMGMSAVPGRSHTTCTILGKETDKILSTHKSTVHPEDIFCRKKGRLYSFKGAIEKLFPPLSKAEKKELWKGFIEISPNPFN